LKSIKRYLYVLLAVFCTLLGPGSVVFYHIYLAPTLGTVEVVVAQEDIPRGQLIKQEQLQIKRVKLEDVVEGVIKDPNKITGKETKYKITRGQQVIPDMIDVDGLYPNENQYNAAIPSQWIYAMPGSLLRGDKVSLYAVEVKDNEIKVEAEGSGFSQEQLNSMNNGQQTNVKIQAEAKLKVEVAKRKGIKVIDNLTVSFAKTSNNHEVTIPEENRFKPTGPVTAVEVIVDQKQWEQIVEYPLKGYKYILMYH